MLYIRPMLHSCPEGQSLFLNVYSLSRYLFFLFSFIVLPRLAAISRKNFTVNVAFSCIVAFPSLMRHSAVRPDKIHAFSFLSENLSGPVPVWLFSA